MSKLIIRYPDNVIKEAEFDQPKYRIGTADDNDLILESDEVEPHQAEIDTVDGAYSVVDVSENKSTTVNGLYELRCICYYPFYFYYLFPYQQKNYRCSITADR